VVIVMKMKMFDMRKALTAVRRLSYVDRKE